MRHYMTFEFVVHLMKNLCLYNVIIPTKFLYDRILDKKIYPTKMDFLNIKVTLCDLQLPLRSYLINRHINYNIMRINNVSTHTNFY